MKMPRNIDINKTREKYYALAKEKGSSSAITALTREMGQLEAHVFDDGYDAERLRVLQEFRELSRDLWTEKYKIKA